jgi:hypothetical protein
MAIIMPGPIKVIPSIKPPPDQPPSKLGSQPPLPSTVNDSNLVTTVQKTVDNAESAASDFSEQVSGLEDKAKSMWGDVSSYFKNWTTVQKVVGETGVGGVLSDLGNMVFKPGQNLMNVGKIMTDQGSARPAQDSSGRWYVRDTPGMKVENFFGKIIGTVGKSERQAVQVGRDIAYDVAFGDAYQLLKSNLTGEQMKLVNVLPGGSAWASFNPTMAGGYDKAQNTSSGKLFANLYTGALVGTEAALGAGVVSHVLQGTGPLRWGGPMVNGPNLMKLGAGVLGLSAVTRGIKATNRGTDATKLQTKEYQREYALSHTKSQGGNLPDDTSIVTTPTPPVAAGANVTNYYNTDNRSSTTNNTTTGPEPAPTTQPDSFSDFLNTDQGKGMWDAIIAGQYAKGASSVVQYIGSTLGGDGGGATQGEEAYGGGSGGPTRTEPQKPPKLSTHKKKKKLKLRQSGRSSMSSGSSKPVKLARAAIQTP